MRVYALKNGSRSSKHRCFRIDCFYLWHIHTMEYYMPIKTDELKNILLPAAMWMHYRVVQNKIILIEYTLCAHIYMKFKILKNKTMDCFIYGSTMVAQMVKNPPAMRETWVWSLGWEDPLEKGIATHSSILSWRIPIDRGSRQATIYNVTKTWTWLTD